MPASTRRRAGRPASRRPNIIRHFVNDGSMFGGETLSDLYYEQWIPANEMVLDVSAAPTAGTRQQTTLQAAHYDYLEFADGVDTLAYFQLTVPEGIDSSANTVSFVGLWETDTAVGTETVNWRFQYAAVADGENLAASAGNVWGQDDNAKGTTRYLAITSSVTVSIDPSLVAGDMWMMQIQRRGTDGGDDLTDVARLLGVAVQWHELGASNAQWS